MEDNNNSSAIKMLVDALSQSLRELSDKINNYYPVLTQLGQNTTNQINEINKLLFETQNIMKFLDSTVGDFYSRTDTIISDLKNINIKLDNIKKTVDSDDRKIDNKIIPISEKIDNVNTLLTSKSDELFGEMKKANTHVEPIGKVFLFLGKPLGLLIFIIGLIIASWTITNCVQMCLEYFGATKNNVTQQSTLN